MSTDYGQQTLSMVPELVEGIEFGASTNSVTEYSRTVDC